MFRFMWEWENPTHAFALIEFISSEILRQFSPIGLRDGKLHCRWTEARFILRSRLASGFTHSEPFKVPILAASG